MIYLFYILSVIYKHNINYNIPVIVQIFSISEKWLQNIKLEMELNGKKVKVN